MAKKKSNDDIFYGLVLNEEQEKLKETIMDDEHNVVIDECQNMSVPIIKRIISRCYDNCKVIILGCQAQTDVPLNKSGFKQLIDHMEGFEGSKKCDLCISYRGNLAMHIDKL